ncbi:MAG: hypothetical protein U0Y08_14940 [Bacteroidia bacterium]
MTTLVTRQEEPYESRDSRTVPWEGEGEIPSPDPIGKRNQILSNDNFAIGNDNTVNDGSTANVLAGQNNIVKANSSLVSGDFNNVQENLSSVIGGSGNTILALNTSILNSYNTQIQTGATSSLILGLNSFTATSANTVYLNRLVVRDLTGATTRLVTVGFDGLLSTTPMISSGGGSGEYWTGSTGFQSLKRNNSANNQLSGEYGIITAGKNNYVSADSSIVGSGVWNLVYSIYSGILSGKRNTINSFQKYSSILAGSGNTINSSYSSILAGQSNYIGHSFSSILAGRNLTSVSADTAHAQNLFIRNEVRISGLTGVGNRMVITSANGTLSTQAIPSYSGKWTTGSVYSSVVLNNGYTTAGSDYSLVAGKINTISSNNPYSSILGGVGNKIQDNSLSSIIVGGQENYIRDYGKYSFLGAGRSNYVLNSKHSVITGGYGNRIYNNASNSESKYNSIINGYVNKINRGIGCTVIGSYNLIGNGDLIKYGFVSGKGNRLYSSYSNILGCYGVTLSDNYTTLVDRLQISGTQNVANNYLLNINPSDWKVNRTRLSGGTGISITTTNGNLTFTYTGSTSSGGSYVLNGINTFTGGTSNGQSVNITGASLSNLTVSGLTSLSSVSATTIYSGSTDLSNLFEPRQTNYRQILSTNYVMTSSTSTAQFTFPILAGEIYKAEMLSLFQVNNTGGMKLTLSGNALWNGFIQGNTNSVLSVAFRPLSTSGNTTNLGTAANTTFQYYLSTIISASTNTTIALGFSPQTNGQQVTVYSGACMTLQKI